MYYGLEIQEGLRVPDTSNQTVQHPVDVQSSSFVFLSFGLI